MVCRVATCGLAGICIDIIFAGKWWAIEMMRSLLNVPTYECCGLRQIIRLRQPAITCCIRQRESKRECMYDCHMKATMVAFDM